jgi:hypothetical protein
MSHPNSISLLTDHLFKYGSAFLYPAMSQPRRNLTIYDLITRKPDKEELDRLILCRVGLCEGMPMAYVIHPFRKFYNAKYLINRLKGLAHDGELRIEGNYRQKRKVYLGFNKTTILDYLKAPRQLY